MTLVDALDTLLIVGNDTEFRRVYKVLVIFFFKLSIFWGKLHDELFFWKKKAERTDFDADINVSVFETNIRILGGLISGHLFARK